MSRFRRQLVRALGVLALLGAVSPASAGLDLSRVGVVHLANGLTVLLLEDHSLPVVSTQVIYKSGARDEAPGKTGLAHFLEHLAFRGSQHYPDAAATRAIYDAGGEWHGYTWLDETAYFATMPASGLDLLLDIEADRMARVTIDPEGVAAEKGAVLTEMHGYENDPDSVLYDETVAAALQAHPYRNNTIGYQSDVEALTAADAKAYYESHYAPGNAVLAIAGDFDPAAAMALVRKHFGSLPARPVAQRTRAIEPVQRGERRTLITGPVQQQFVKFVYPAPAASSPDFPAFLVLQQLLSGSSGANFQQNDGSTPATAGAELFGVAGDVKSWFIPTGDPYVFVISASIGAQDDRAALEREMAVRIEKLRLQQPSAAVLASARETVAGELVYDVQTSEDAAHQLAYYEGIGALDVLLALPGRVAAVTAPDVRRVAQQYLDPQRRTVGWYVPGTPPQQPAIGEGKPKAAEAREPVPPGGNAAPPPTQGSLAGGLPVIVQHSPLTQTVTVALLLSAPVAGEQSPEALSGLGMIARSGMAGDLPDLIAGVREALAAARPDTAGDRSGDPETRLEQMIAERAGRGSSMPQPLAVFVSGAVDTDTVMAALGPQLGHVVPGSLPKLSADTLPAGDAPERVVERIALPLSQAAIGYVVPAPPAATREGLAACMLLYILSHHYAGRLGQSAIADTGLVYYIGSAYRSDGARSWITLSSGVDPDKIDAMEQAMRAEIARLRSDPPRAAEIAAARQHLLGRDLSAAQSNPEIVERLARQFAETGGLRSHAELSAALAQIGSADIADAARTFGRGTILRVDVGPEGK